ncbi:T9SS type A sorting domain-containing protein [Candidatus Pacearchaeota archaeon]|nr:T9SS type A sorting domain-containing protein [Candidatus Pacearchaeota archaeon]MBI2057098.1 T9SS type A sorting domain-containing protein [Candidatus Pacearchaeota archaeon]
MTSNANCANPTTATSNTITISVTSNVQASLSISVSPSSTICAGDNATFTATNTNSVPSPFYQWKLNNINVGTNSSTYSNSNLLNGNQIKCILSSSSSCVVGSPATSNIISMTVNTCTGISDFDFNDKIKFFPNPVKEKLIVQFENFKNFEIKLLNVLGKEIYNEKISDEKTEINLSEYGEGIYFLSVETEEGITRRKIFVVR